MFDTVAKVEVDVVVVMVTEVMMVVILNLREQSPAIDVMPLASNVPPCMQTPRFVKITRLFPPLAVSEC